MKKTVLFFLTITFVSIFLSSCIQLGKKERLETEYIILVDSNSFGKAGVKFPIHSYDANKKNGDKVWIRESYIGDSPNYGGMVFTTEKETKKTAFSFRVVSVPDSVITKIKASKEEFVDIDTLDRLAYSGKIVSKEKFLYSNEWNKIQSGPVKSF